MTKLIKAALAAGVEIDRIAGVTLNNDGVTILFGEPKTIHTTPIGNEWDEVIKK